VFLHPELFEEAATGPLRVRDENEILVAPLALLNSDPEIRPAAIRRLVGKFDTLPIGLRSLFTPRALVEPAQGVRSVR
jgi:hypothetical protein